MSALPNPDANDIGRYGASAPAIPSAAAGGFAAWLNLLIEDVSAAISRLAHRNRYALLTFSGALPNNATTALGAAAPLLYTEAADADGWHSAAFSTDRIQPTVAGRYLVMVECEFASNVTGIRVVQIGRNGVLSNQVRALQVANSDSVASTQLAREVTMNGSTDYITVHAFQNSGAGLTITGNVVVRYVGPS